MPIEEIRVPAPAWSNSFLEQNRFFIDIGFNLLLLAVAISPFVVLYIRRKSPTGWLDLVLLVAALAGFPYATSYALSWLFGKDYAVLRFVVLVISSVMVICLVRWGKRYFVARSLTLLLLVGILPTFPSAGERSRQSSCAVNLRTLGITLLNADRRIISLKNPPPHNDSLVDSGAEVSWRVKLLPYIELDHVYQQYEFKSPWDSQANWAIACRRVELFTCPSEPDMTNPNGGRFTSYVMLENTNKNLDNPNLIYDQDSKLLDTNRILLIESCGANVVWTEPRDADVDTLRWSLKPANRKEEKEPWRSRNVGASSHAGVVQVVYGDGSTRCLSKSIDEGVLRKVILGQASADELD
jgi:hypothetical protein